MSRAEATSALIDNLIETAKARGWEADMGTGADSNEVHAAMLAARAELERAISSKPSSDRMAVGE